MNSDKRNALIVLVIALGFVGYSYYLTSKVQESEEQINALKASMSVKPVEKKSTKFSVLPAKYCDSISAKAISFDGKNNFESQTLGNDAIKGTYQIEKNSIIITPSKNSQYELIIKSWNDNKAVIEFSLDGKTYSTSHCKTPEQEQQEKEKSIQESLEKEKSENEKIEREKQDKERIEKERLEKEKIEKERIDLIMQKLDKIEQAKLEQERLEKEKVEKEKQEQEKLLQERLEKEKQEQERLEKEKVEKEKLELERIEKEKLELEKKTQVSKTSSTPEKSEGVKIEISEEDELKMMKDKTN